ncbi:hypothetical protein HMPREF1552_00028 [Leptotrichia sp. oral taxon 879 str. F0557]|nr:hypothetical protein HMPREF1552_00028 [Leptotrichia sp. oral taxon 879 str. F0557]
MSMKGSDKMKKIMVILIFTLGMLGFSAKMSNNNSVNIDKLIGYWYYSKVGYQDPIGIKKLSNGTYQIGFNTGEKNADKNGFEWDNIQLLRNGIYKIQGMDRYIHIIKNGFVIKDGNGNIIDYLDRKLNKLP